MTGLVSNYTIEALSELCRDVFRPVPGVERKVTGAIAAMCSQNSYVYDPLVTNVDDEFCRLSNELAGLVNQSTVGNGSSMCWKLWNTLKNENGLEKGCKALTFILNEKRKEVAKGAPARLPAGDSSGSFSRQAASTPITSQLKTPVPPTYSTIAHELTNGKSMVTKTAPTFSRNVGTSTVPQQKEKLKEPTVQLSPSPCSKSLSQAIVNATMGYESELFTFDPRTKEMKITDEHRFDPSLRSLFRKLGKIGKSFNYVRSFVDSVFQGSESPLKKAFAAGVDRYLQEYYHQARAVDTAPTVDDPDEMKLMHLTHYLEPWTYRMKLLADMVSACRKLQGGALLSKLHRFCMTGDDSPRQVSYDVLTRVCCPLLDAIMRWLVEGKIADNHREFFIRQDGAVMWSSDETRLDDWWGQKYLVRYEEVPVFLSEDIVEDILTVGKNVAFAATVCRRVNPIPGMKELYELFRKEVTPECLFLEGKGEMGSMRDVDNNLYTKEGDYMGTIVDKMAQLSSSYVYHDLVLKECGLVNELVGLRQFVLLGSGEFTQSLINWMRPVLDLPASEVTLPMVRGPLENALKEVFASYSSGTRAAKSYFAITERVDVKLFDASGSESGWDIFMLYYRIDGPLRAIITQQHMTYYSQLFRCLWKMQRTSYVTKKLWMEVKNAGKLFPFVPEICSTVRDILVLVSAMSHMVKELYFFLSSEVIGIEWSHMMSQVEEANSLDEVAEAHTGFLEAVFQREFLRDANSGMFPRLLGLQALIINLHPIVTNFMDAVAAENERRAKDVVKPKVPPKKAGLVPVKGDRAAMRKAPPVKGPTPVKLSEKEKLSRLTFQSTSVESCKGKVAVIQDAFRAKMCEFLMELAGDGDPSLLPLSMRLDFNEFFAMRDNRLQTPMTLRKQLERSMCSTGSRSKETAPGSGNLLRDVLNSETPSRTLKHAGRSVAILK